MMVSKSACLAARSSAIIFGALRITLASEKHGIVKLPWLVSGGTEISFNAASFSKEPVAASASAISCSNEFIVVGLLVGCLYKVVFVEFHNLAIGVEAVKRNLVTLFFFEQVDHQV